MTTYHAYTTGTPKDRFHWLPIEIEALDTDKKHIRVLFCGAHPKVVPEEMVQFNHTYLRTRDVPVERLPELF